MALRKPLIAWAARAFIDYSSTKSAATASLTLCLLAGIFGTHSRPPATACDAWVRVAFLREAQPWTLAVRFGLASHSSTSSFLLLNGDICFDITCVRCRSRPAIDHMRCVPLRRVHGMNGSPERRQAVRSFIAPCHAEALVYPDQRRPYTVSLPSLIEANRKRPARWKRNLCFSLAPSRARAASRGRVDRFFIAGRSEDPLVLMS